MYVEEIPLDTNKSSKSGILFPSVGQYVFVYIIFYYVPCTKYTSTNAAMSNSTLPTLPVRDVNLTHNLQYGTQLAENFKALFFSVYYI